MRERVGAWPPSCVRRIKGRGNPAEIGNHAPANDGGMTGPDHAQMMIPR